MDKPFVLEAYFDATTEKVWQALTDLQAMKAWYFPQLKSFQPLVGFDMEFDDDGSLYKKQWRVTQMVTGRMWAHNWDYIGYPGSSEVIFEVFKMGDGTRLRLTHTGLTSFPNDPHFSPHRFEEGWQRLIADNLKHFL